MTEPPAEPCHIGGGAPIDRRVMWNSVGTRLFDVPVYRVSPEQWWQEQEREYQRHYEYSWGRWGEEAPESAKWRIRQMVHDETGIYQFNQIMGWVQVVWDGPGPVVKCYYVRVATRRVKRLFRQRHFADVGKIAEVWFSRNATSDEIITRIRAALVRETRSRGALHGRFLDFEIIDNLTPVLDLRKLLGLG